LISGILAQKYLRTYCTYLRRLAASKRPLSKGKNPLMVDFIGPELKIIIRCADGRSGSVLELEIGKN
jgi:hypothetical protein